MHIEQMPCNPGNYTHPRTAAIQYIVIHYTGAPGTARNCGTYFGREGNIGASAHYFVDETTIVQSVKDGDRAWHCGAKTYQHPACRNDNSIGVELCCDKDAAGVWYFAPETVHNAAVLVRALMARYGIDTDHVIRHYDVTGKICPAPFVRDAEQWENFKARLTAREEDEEMVRYNSISEMPAHYRAEAQRLIDSGALAGRTAGKLDVSEDMLRTLIIVQRMLEK